MWEIAIPIIIFGGIYFLSGLRVIKQWEQALIFTLGKYKGLRGAGLTWILPGIQILNRIDIRVRTLDVRPQEIITMDSATVTVDAVVYFKVVSPEKAKLNVANFEFASSLLAQSALRDVLGTHTLDELLSRKKELGKQILENIQGPTDDWGVTVTTVEIKNIEIPPNMKRAMAKEAEAIREKRARQLKAEAEVDASKLFNEAAIIMEKNPIAYRLRELQTWQEIGTEQNSLMILIPTGMEGLAKNIAVATGVNMLKQQEPKSKPDKAKLENILGPDES
jgi:regulator of protease activity HflC (stomatin/prohibitin superfamily)